MTKKLLSIALFAIFAVNVAFAQSGTLTGTVTSSDTDETLPAVNVIIVELERGAPTDVDGNYEINNIPYGTYTLRVSSVGFVTFEQPINIDQDETEFDIELSPDTQQLEGLV
ncbi:MAG: carboxypeptidase-like regulatory domain-containing protein, partial [Candidatus Paceibacterota bacterium]